MRNSIIILVFAAVLILFSGCGRNKEISLTPPNAGHGDADLSMLASPGHDVLSPSSKYRLSVSLSNDDQVENWSFLVKEAQSNTIVYRSSDIFRVRDTVFVLWDEEDRVWVYSGDVGTFIWSKVNNQWVKQAYADTINMQPPVLLKALRPKYY